MSLFGIWLPAAFLLLAIWILFETIAYVRTEFITPERKDR